MLFHIDGPRQKVEAQKMRAVLSWWTGWFLITGGPTHSQPSWECVSTQEARRVPEVPAVPDALCWTEGFKRKQRALCRLPTAHITAAFNTAPAEIATALHRGSENTFISIASRSASLLIFQPGFAMEERDDFQHQWLFRPELHRLFLEPAVQFSLLVFSCVLNRASTVCCWRKHWTQEWTKRTAESTGTVKIALPGNWSEWAGGHKELRCPRLRACLKPFHHRLEVKRQHSSLLKS